MGHKWRFCRTGGFTQVRLETGSDLAALDELDQKLWVALSCPTRGTEMDPRTLDLIDADQDGRIRAPDLVAAIKWAAAVLRSPDELLAGTDAMPLSAINDQVPEGRVLLASARQVLAALGKEGTTSITVDDTSDMTRIFSQTMFNGDGIIPADAADDEPTKAVINDIIACFGAETDRNGRPGVSQAGVDRFFAAAQAYSDWWRQAEEKRDVILPLGDGTAAAAEVLASVKGKIEDYFARCRLAEYDARALTALNRQEGDYLALAVGEMTITAEEVAGFPLARIEPGRPLPLAKGLNPAWTARIAAFLDAVVKPVLGEKTSLTEEEWATCCGRFSAHEAWASGVQGAEVRRLGLARVREILAGGARETIARLIAKDAALASEFQAVASLDRLVRYHRDLYTLVRNFVSFIDFYTRKKAVFQAGTLYLDGRSCDLCLKVADAGAHSALAGLSRLYLAYCDCARRGGAEKMTIAAAFTDGDSDFLRVGRNGVFYDRAGRDWDATIVKLVEHPISIRQAFWAPYKRFGRMISEQVEKMAAAREKAVEAKAAAGMAEAGARLEEPKPAPAVPFDIAKFAGIFAAIGLAIGAIGAVLADAVTGFFGLTWWQMPLAVVTIVLVISLPSMILAYLKLRQRNLGPILDGNGWAINARPRINLMFGKSLTAVAALPPGSQRSFRDPYVRRRRAWPIVVAILVVLAGAAYVLNATGLLHQWTGIGRPAGGPASRPAEEG